MCRYTVSPTAIGYSYPLKGKCTCAFMLIIKIFLRIYITQEFCRLYLNSHRSVSIHEDGYVNDSREDVEALKKADACLTTPARRYLSSSIPEENILLVENESEEEDVDLAFAESIERNHGEFLLLTVSNYIIFSFIESFLTSLFAVEEAPLTKSAK